MVLIQIISIIGRLEVGIASILSHVTVTSPDILEAAGACVYQRGAFNVWCEEHGVFEYLTSEFVMELAQYICASAEVCFLLAPFPCCIFM